MPTRLTSVHSWFRSLRSRPAIIAVWTGLLLIAAISLALALNAERVLMLWPLEETQREIHRLEPTASVSQRVDVPFGSVTGFTASIRPLPDQEGGVLVANLRLRRAGGSREILREARVKLSAETGTVATTGLQSPLAPSLSRTVEFEIEADALNAGKLMVLGSIRPNLPYNALTINGAPTAPDLRADVVPIIRARTGGFLLATFNYDIMRSGLYLLATLALSLLAVLMLNQVRGNFSTLPAEPLVKAGILLAAGPLCLTALAIATAIAKPATERRFMLEIADAYWGAAFGVVWLFAIASGAAWAASIMYRKRRLEGGDWRRFFHLRIAWRGVLALSLLLLASAVPFALWHRDQITSDLGSAALVTLLVGVALALIAELPASDPK